MAVQRLASPASSGAANTPRGVSRRCRSRGICPGLQALSNPELEPAGDFVEPWMMLDDSEDEPLKLPANVASSRFETISAAIEKQVHDQERGALVPVGKSMISR
jgi:hypothetical protein